MDLVDASGRTATMLAAGDTLVVRAQYRADERVQRPVFQLGIIDVDTGLVIATATSSRVDAPRDVLGSGLVEWRFAGLPLRPRVGRRGRRSGVVAVRVPSSQCRLCGGTSSFMSGRRF